MTNTWSGVVMNQKVSTNGECRGEHSFFCAETVANEAEGKVYLLGFCTHCGLPLRSDFEVGSGSIALLPK